MKDAMREARRNLEKEIDLEASRGAQYLEELHNLGDHTVDEGSSTRSTVQLLGSSQRLKHYSDGLSNQIAELSDNYFTQFPLYSKRITAEEEEYKRNKAESTQSKFSILSAEEWAALDQSITEQTVDDDTIYPMDIIVNLFQLDSWNDKEIENVCQLIDSILCDSANEECADRLFHRWINLFVLLSDSEVDRSQDHIVKISNTISNVITKITTGNHKISLDRIFKQSCKYLGNSNYSPMTEDILITGFSVYIQSIWRDLVTPSESGGSDDDLTSFLSSFNNRIGCQDGFVETRTSGTTLAAVNEPCNIVMNDFVFQPTPLLTFDGEDDTLAEGEGAGKWAEPLNIFLTQGEGLLDKMSGITSTFKF